MTLIRCPGCGTAICHVAESCPICGVAICAHCGHTFSRPLMMRIYRRMLQASCLLFLLGCAYLLLLRRYIDASLSLGIGLILGYLGLYPGSYKKKKIV